MAFTTIQSVTLDENSRSVLVVETRPSGAFVEGNLEIPFTVEDVGYVAVWRDGQEKRLMIDCYGSSMTLLNPTTYQARLELIGPLYASDFGQVGKEQYPFLVIREQAYSGWDYWTPGCVEADGYLNDQAASALAGSAPTHTVVNNVGGAAPPATLGPYSMTAAPVDNREDQGGEEIWTIPLPNAGQIELREINEILAAMYHFKAGPDGYWTGIWASGHSYVGDAYFPNDGTRVLHLPEGTGAFYMYVTHQQWVGTLNVEVTADDGTKSTTTHVADGGGAGLDAKYVGIYAAPGQTLRSVHIKSTNPGNWQFIVGEFGWAAALSATTLPPTTLPPTTIPPEDESNLHAATLEVARFITPTVEIARLERP